VGDVFEDLVYQGSPLSRPVIGYKETVSKLKRADFLNHWNTWYDPKHVVLGLVGKLPLPEDELLLLIEQYFRKGVERPGGGVHTDQLVAQDKPRLAVTHKKTEQAHFHLGFPGISRFDKDRYALGLLSTIAGGNSSSRMFNEIREKRGLAYYAYTSADLNRDVGSFFAFEGVSLEKATEAVKVTLAEFEKLREGGIADEEVERAKDFVVGKIKLDTEDSARMADMMVERAMFEGAVVPVEEIISRYQQVTPDQVRAVAKRVINFKKTNLAVIGPFKKKDFEPLI
jgi:predicted Zn-dependent peptidase